ncbi:MAG: electron transfer flavoprotein-ubiquinone oxidoreductase [Pseudomonadales bacterium]|jgi:electron-transferring-flavoprotein dehydrogenase|nr:electron transfer flavoprotein-ubiquinone oxidoreductase [Pseudomonadales bacterium]MDP6473046.1 electron transfer flavoprotein-ubiquinone oxidoreductase [Pseudomonadales bacterium]MDP6826197.1 electron transfer flavoprotein-ubiquinone oxidoreductase [Pseudomonadales bacterium]MDP6973426.1 electron transfer flavoprotein-ubiquinone oxidoreductase [Pseudomonadales bacterium]
MAEDAQETERESMEFDVVIVGGGPAGLSAACRLVQMAEAAGSEVSVCLVEKGSEVGAHILSGAVFETTALDELFPDWQECGAPVNNPVTTDSIYYMVNGTNRIKVPSLFVPGDAHNEGNHAISLGNLCRWLGEQAEAMGVNIFPGFAASEVLYNDDGSVRGIATGDMGIGADGEAKGTYTPGYELHAKYTIFAEGCRGHLGKQLIAKYHLEANSGTQHYGIGLKELWDVNPEKHEAGKVIHSVGWPLGHFPGAATGGSFIYHLENNQVALGLIVDLSYSNPHLSPFDEFQRWKHHPLVAEQLEGGTRVSYGARAIVKGGLTGLPKASAPGAILVGDDAGFLNVLKIKGSHTAMKTGMMAAESIFDALAAGDEGGSDLEDFQTRFEASWVFEELNRSRNAGPGLHKLGMLMGSAHALFGSWVGGWPYTLADPKPDHATLKPAAQSKTIDYPKPDGVLSFDKLSSVFLSNTNHEEDQPCHLRLTDAHIPLQSNLPQFDEPAQRYCPAGVYEIIEENDAKYFQINAQNCVHCKTCDIKDPAQNITWVVPEGTGGPNYPNM